MKCVYFVFDIVSPTGAVIYSELKTFLKKQPDVITTYKSIATANETIILTRNHLLYTRENLDDQFNPM